MVTDTDNNSPDADKIAETKRICLGLQSQDRKVRKQCYVELHKCLSNEASDFTHQDLRNIFGETHMYFINGLRDKTELVREQAIKFITYLIVDRLPLNDFYLTYIFPVIVERIGSPELVEESEEIRLMMLQLLEAIVDKYSNTAQLKPFLNDSVIVLSESVKDRYPMIKELSCKTIIKLAKALPRDFHMQAESLVKPILTCFSHQRYRVRVEAVKAIGEVIMHSSYKGVDEVLVPMAEKLFDQIPLVRQTVAQEAARWLLEHRDRYSFFYKMLPLLMTGLNDEVESTRQEAHQLWQKVGLQYQQENEQDLKDKLDYLTQHPKHYPTHLQRPNLGCRVLVQRNITRIAGGVSNELTSWQEDVRVRCSQLLCSLVLHVEEDITFSLQTLLPSMYSAAKDDDRRVVVNIIQASEIMGLFVDCDTWSKLVFPAVEDGPHYGHLTVLAGLIGGTPKENIVAHLERIGGVLAEDYICCSRKKKYQLEMLRCVKVIMEKCQSHMNSNTGYSLFKIITSLIALKDSENSDSIQSTLYDELAKSLTYDDKAQVFLEHMNPLLNHVNRSPKSWLPVTENACIFLVLLSESNEALSYNMDLVCDILMEVLDPETDAELRLKAFYVLATVFDSKEVAFKRADNLTATLRRLVKDVFIPSLVWHAGATAETIRTMAATCLKYALTPADGVDLFASSEDLICVMDKLLPLLLSLVEDASYRSRQVAIECLMLLKEHCVRKGVWSNDDLIKIYPEVLKRLDDPTEKVRVSGLRGLAVLFAEPPLEFTQPNFKAHHELIIDTLLTHFDDDDEGVQMMVFDVLKVLVQSNRKELARKIEVHRPLLRNQKGCDDILSFVETL